MLDSLREAKERWPLLAIPGFFLLSAFLVAPLRDVPVIDDWTYAWSVEHLLRTGRLAVLDWSAHYPILQTYWGGLWAAAFGFSFGVLRLSTAALAAAGCVALYLLLGELGIGRGRALLGAFALAANPAFFVLSFSFMTDVPFLSLTIIVLYCYAAGLKRERPGWLWAGGGVAAGAFLCRQIGIVTPMAVAPLLVFKREHGALLWGPPFWRRLLPVAASLAAMLALLFWMSASLGRTSVMQERAGGLRYLHLVSPGDYLKQTLFLMLQGIFYASPLLLAGIWSRRRLLTTAALAPAIAGFLWLCFGKIPSPLPLGGMWSLTELAGVRWLVRGTPAGPGVAEVFDWPARALMVVAAAALIGGVASLRTRGPLGRGEVLLLAYGLLQLGMINALWLFYDRYALALLPVLIYVALKIPGPGSLRRGAAWGGVVLLAFVSVSGTWDALRFNEACAEAFRGLRERGVPAAEIDAGYSLTGWTLYAHPENLPPGDDPRRDAPWVTSGKELPYIIANSPLPGCEVLGEVTWRGSWWAVSNRLYVLKRLAHG